MYHAGSQDIPVGMKKGQANSLNLLIGLLQKALDGSSHHSDSYSQLIHKVLKIPSFEFDAQLCRLILSEVSNLFNKLSLFLRTIRTTWRGKLTSFQAMHVNQLSTEEQRELAACIAPDTDKCTAIQRAR